MLSAALSIALRSAGIASSRDILALSVQAGTGVCDASSSGRPSARSGNSAPDAYRARGSLRTAFQASLPEPERWRPTHNKAVQRMTPGCRGCNLDSQVASSLTFVVRAHTFWCRRATPIASELLGACETRLAAHVRSPSHYAARAFRKSKTIPSTNPIFPECRKRQRIKSKPSTGSLKSTDSAASIVHIGKACWA